MSVFSNLVYSFNAIPIKMSASYKLILIFIWKDLEQSEDRTVNKILKEKNSQKADITDFKTNYNAIVIKTLWY